MKKELLASFAGLLAGAGLALGQAAADLPPPTSGGTETAAIPPVVGKEGPRKEEKLVTPPEADKKAEAEKPAAEKKPEAMSGGWANDLVEAPSGRYTVDLEGLFFFNKNGRSLPPLVAGGIEGGRITGGVGQPTLAGGPTGASLDYGLFTGGRLAGGYWWDDCYGVELTGGFLGRQAIDYRNSNSDVLSRPYFNINAGQESSILIGFPGIAHGSVTVSSSSQTWGSAAYLCYNLIDDPIVDGVRLDLCIGPRYLELNEDLVIQSSTNFNQIVPASFTSFAGNQVQIVDNFITKNRFLGGELVGRARFYGDFINLDLSTKFALGTNFEEIVIRGAQLRTFANGSTTLSPGGLLALPSNIGRFRRDQFTVGSELEGNMNVPITKNLAFNLGFALWFWNRVVRPSDQIDRDIDVNQLPNFGGNPNRNNLSRPGVPYTQSTYYILGFNTGFEVHW